MNTLPSVLINTIYSFSENKYGENKSTLFDLCRNVYSCKKDYYHYRLKEYPSYKYYKKEIILIAKYIHLYLKIGDNHVNVDFDISKLGYIYDLKLLFP